MFSHKKLSVYHKSLDCVAVLAQDTSTWDKRHAFVDHLLRASESILLNLVESTRLHSMAHRQHYCEFALGSALECAACLDIAVQKQLLIASTAVLRKQSLCEVVRMLAGLRRSWGNDQLHEEEESYAVSPKLFAHERLEVYQVSVQFISWFQHQPGGATLSSRFFRLLDKLGTGVVLNIAEGNGRFFEGDRRKLLDTAEASAAKAAAYLDLSCQGGEIALSQRDYGLELLERVVQMLYAMRRS